MVKEESLGKCSSAPGQAPCMLFYSTLQPYHGLVIIVALDKRAQAPGDSRLLSLLRKLGQLLCRMELVFLFLFFEAEGFSFVVVVCL